jgi:hypothetical protein
MGRRSLSVVEPCPRALEVRPVAQGLGWCEHCRRHVHDLSATTELEARAHMRAAAGERTCIVLRTHADGTLAFRDPERAWTRAAMHATVALAILTLVACTAHGVEGATCRGGDGAERICPERVERSAPALPGPPPPPRLVPFGPFPEGKGTVSAGVSVPDPADERPRRASRRARRAAR